MFFVHDVMNSSVVTLPRTATLHQATTLLAANHISGVPVVDDKDELVGMISELALFDVLFDPTIQHHQVDEYMTREVFTVAEDDSLTDVAHRFAYHGVRRFPVVRDGKLIGIVTRRDLLAFCQEHGDELSASEVTPMPFADELSEIEAS